MTVSREEAGRRRANGDDDDDDDRSDRSSDQSDLDDGISPFLGDSKITVSTTLSDPSKGIKLKIRKLPKPDPILPDPEPVKEPEKNEGRLSVPEKPESKPKRLWNPTGQLTYNAAFEQIELPYKIPLMFQFSYLGAYHQCEYHRTVRTMFDDVPDCIQLSHLNLRMRPIGKSRLPKPSKARLHKHQSSLHCIL